MVYLPVGAFHQRSTSRALNLDQWAFAGVIVHERNDPAIVIGIDGDRYRLPVHLGVEPQAT
jgi:hypothetical protein